MKIELAADVPRDDSRERMQALRQRRKEAGKPRPKDKPLTASQKVLMAESQQKRREGWNLAGIPRHRDKARKSDIVGVDGEGLTRPTGEHDYTLLADSTGERIEAADGLGTEDCLRFLLRSSTKLAVAFGFSYDANKIVHDLRPGRLLRLHKLGSTLYRGESGTLYRITFTPRKALTISVVDETGDKPKAVQTVTVWDTFGFYQTGFVKALRAWGVGTAAQLAQLDGMKGLRSDFANVEEDAVRAYNDLECRLLVELTQLLRETIERAGYRLGRWDGAGALASAMLRKHGVKDHLNDDYPVEALRAYFGGRIQVLQLGEVSGPIYNYDINSAYPAVAEGLPSLVNAHWTRVDSYSPSEWALWHVRWNLQQRDKLPHNPTRYGADKRYHHSPTPILTPFPFRDSVHNIHYPVRGEGWYWSPLVDLAVKNWTGIEVVSGYRLETDSDARPFSFVGELFSQRQEYKRAGDARHIILKLGLNAMYGKLAQGVGWRDTKPAYRNYVYAGLITAAAQARLLEAALQKPSSVVSFATDGIYSREPLDLPIGEGLGQWEESIYDKMLIFQPGLYILYKGSEPVYRTRGYFPEEIDWAEMGRLWRQAGPFASYDFSVSRFLSLGVALQTHQLKRWGRWVDSPRNLSLRPATGFVGSATGPHSMQWEPDYEVRGEPISRPFSPKRSKYEIEQDIRRSWDEDQPDPLT